MLGLDNKIDQKMDLNPLFLAKTKLIIIHYDGFHKKYEIPLKRNFFHFIFVLRVVQKIERNSAFIKGVYGLIHFKT